MSLVLLSGMTVCPASLKMQKDYRSVRVTAVEAEVLTFVILRLFADATNDNQLQPAANPLKFRLSLLRIRFLLRVH
jgi:hypothetical protein